MILLGARKTCLLPLKISISDSPAPLVAFTMFFDSSALPVTEEFVSAETNGFSPSLANSMILSCCTSLCVIFLAVIPWSFIFNVAFKLIFPAFLAASSPTADFGIK